MQDWRAELTGRVLVLVAHADDESVGFGALIRKMREPVVAIVTDGAPRDVYFWGRYGSRQAYAAVRRDEARAAMRVAGARELALLSEEDARLEDQRLFLHLESAYALLERLARHVRPGAIATLAYEGGHPDHDCCSLLGWLLGKRLGVPVWEAPAYHRTGAVGECEGEIRLQRFLRENGSEARVEISEGELARKRAMCAEYASQAEVVRPFDLRRELVRPQERYDFRRAPHAGRTNYECWRWWMSAREVSARFAEFLEREG